MIVIWFNSESPTENAKSSWWGNCSWAWEYIQNSTRSILKSHQFEITTYTLQPKKRTLIYHHHFRNHQLNTTKLDIPKNRHNVAYNVNVAHQTSLPPFKSPRMPSLRLLDAARPLQVLPMSGAPKELFWNKKESVDFAEKKGREFRKWFFLSSFYQLIQVILQ